MQNSRGWSVLWNKWCKTGEAKWAEHCSRFQAYLPPDSNRKRDTQYLFQCYKRPSMCFANARVPKSNRNTCHHSFNQFFITILQHPFPLPRSGFLVYFFRLRDRLCGLVVRVPGDRTQMYCVSCEVRTELYMLCRRK
jgi:hypothetical protein